MHETVRSLKRTRMTVRSVFTLHSRVFTIVCKPAMRTPVSLTSTILAATIAIVLPLARFAADAGAAKPTGDEAIRN